MTGVQTCALPICGDYLDVRFAVNEAVKRELDARGIAIPYPQLDVHFEPQKRNT